MGQTSNARLNTKNVEMGKNISEGKSHERGKKCKDKTTDGRQSEIHKPS